MFVPGRGVRTGFRLYVEGFAAFEDESERHRFAFLNGVAKIDQHYMQSAWRQPGAGAGLDGYFVGMAHARNAIVISRRLMQFDDLAGVTGCADEGVRMG